jgi:hypothetical protein
MRYDAPVDDARRAGGGEARDASNVGTVGGTGRWFVRMATDARG